jgi:hypothetical protein
MGHFLKIKCVDSRMNVHILASTSVTFTLTTVQVPNLALTHTKRITVYNMNEEKIVNIAEEGIIKNESIRRSKLYKKGRAWVQWRKMVESE